MICRIGRGLYSNALGFLGGFSWTVMCAHACQLFPQAGPVELIRNFFKYYNEFNWKDKAVVLDTPHSAKKPYKKDPKVCSFATFAHFPLITSSLSERFIDCCNNMRTLQKLC